MIKVKILTDVNCRASHDKGCEDKNTLHLVAVGVAVVVLNDVDVTDRMILIVTPSLFIFSDKCHKLYQLFL